MTVLIVLIAPVAGNLSDRIGSRWLMGAGMTLLGIGGLFWLRIGLHSSYWTLLPPMLIGGVGMALTMSPMTSAAMASVPIDKAGVGSGVLNSFRQVGGSLGIALMGAILASYALPHATRAQSAQEFVDGLHAALLASAIIAFAGAIVAVTTVRTTARSEQRAAESVAA
jgi:MFS family permease